MTREEAIKGLKVLAKDFSGYRPNEEMFNMAIEALEQPEPCEDTISRQAAIDALIEWYGCKPNDIEAFGKIIEALPSAQPELHWIQCSERLPEERDWYLGIFKEPDTEWINPLPFICDYLLGTKTKATTKEGWILNGFTDREEYIDYYFKLECVAWMPLPEPYKERREE